MGKIIPFTRIKEKPNEEFNDRVLRIRKSLERINRVMSDMKNQQTLKCEDCNKDHSTINQSVRCPNCI